MEVPEHNFANEITQSPTAKPEEPPSITSFLEAIMDLQDSEPARRHLPRLVLSNAKCVQWSCKILRLYEALAKAWKRGAHVHLVEVVLLSVEEGVDRSLLERLPAGIALPLQEALSHCRELAPATGWPAEAYALISREDLAMNYSLLSNKVLSCLVHLFFCHTLMRLFLYSRSRVHHCHQHIVFIYRP